MSDTEEEGSFQDPDGEDEIDDSMLSDDEQEDVAADTAQLNIKDEDEDVRESASENSKDNQNIS